MESIVKIFLTKTRELEAKGTNLSNMEINIRKVATKWPVLISSTQIMAVPFLVTIIQVVPAEIFTTPSSCT
jgi:hypothetical protein